MRLLALAMLLLCASSAVAAPDARGRLKTTVEALAGRIGPRAIARPEALRAAEAHVTEALDAAGHRVARLPFTAGGVEVANLEVVIAGREPGQSVVLGAHYDTVPETPGADDNASGVAVLLEVARRLRPLRLRRSVRLVAFVNEEPPYFKTDHMGSLVYARHLRQQKVDVAAMVALDMLGYYDSRPKTQDYPPLVGALYPDTADFVAFVADLGHGPLARRARDRFAEASGLPVQSIAAPRAVTGVDFSDHWSFWQVGYPAFLITDTAFFRNPHYHRPSDRPQTLDFDRLTRAADGVEAVVRDLAGR